MDDISSIDSYNEALKAGLSEAEALHMVEKYGRDNARTPFQWDDTDNAGFTAGKPWLRVNPNYREINLAAEVNDHDSVFNYYKKLIRLRKDPAYKETLVYGELIPYMPDRHDLMAYYRKSSEQTLMVMANFSEACQEIPLPSGPKKILLNNLENDSIRESGFASGTGSESELRESDNKQAMSEERSGNEGAVIKLAPFQAVVIEL